MTLAPFFQFLILLPIVTISVTLHEYAHGWVAHRCGDPTAKLSGRLTLNPLAHVDLVGTVLLPLVFFMMFHILFGWAKPVPVNFMNLRRPKTQMIWVAVAGPVTNIFLAILFSAFFHMGSFSPESLPGLFLILGAFLNLVLFVFNMIPIPPLDGSRVMMGILPSSVVPYYRRLERFGLLIVLLLWATGLLWNILIPIVFTLAAVLGLPHLA